MPKVSVKIEVETAGTQIEVSSRSEVGIGRVRAEITALADEAARAAKAAVSA